MAWMLIIDVAPPVATLANGGGGGGGVYWGEREEEEPISSSPTVSAQEGGPTSRSKGRSPEFFLPFWSGLGAPFRVRCGLV